MSPIISPKGSHWFSSKEPLQILKGGNKWQLFTF